jgi:(p)ppGpp synthase/HD superfamily hydrolase
VDHVTTATPLGPRFEDALIYALHVHAGQTRKQTSVPYAAHLLAVAALVLEDGGDEDQANCALLHDAAEYAGGHGRVGDVRTRFGARVPEIVEGCSDAFPGPGEQKAPWAERKRDYVERLRTEPEHVVRVSVADKLHNARAILRDLRSEGPGMWDRFTTKSALDQVGYYRSVLDAVRGRFASPMVAELERTVAEIATLSGD